MRSDRIEARWIAAFEEVFRQCAVHRDDEVAIVSETQSRRLNVELAELALARLGARPFHVVVPSPAPSTIPIRSTGASRALARREAPIAALRASSLVVDLTVEGILHAPELAQVRGAGARVLMISNEHPDILERLLPNAALRSRVEEAVARLRAARRMTVRSPAGTELAIELAGDPPVRGAWGACPDPGQVSYWPGGLCACFPRPGSVSGTVVLAPGDVNLTFKRYLESAVRLRVERDYVVAVDGDGVDAALLRSYLAAWGDAEAYGVSHVGWGLNAEARWEALTLYDRRDVNGTELRVFAGNFLYSTGANETADRRTEAHFDFPMRGCTVSLDGATVVVDGVLTDRAS